MMTWRPEYVEKNPEIKGAIDTSKHEEAATLLSANPGDMMYWPSDRWHVGSSAGGDVSVVLAIRTLSDGYGVIGEAILDGVLTPFFCRPMRTWDKLKVVAYLIFHRFSLRFSKHKRAKQIKSIPFDPDDLQGSAEVIPEEVREIGKPFAFLFKENLERALSAFWLIHLSTLGAISVEKKLSPVDSKAAFSMKRNMGTIILWRHTETNKLIIVSGLHFHEMSVSFLPIIKYICNIKEEQELSLKDLILLGEELELSLCDNHLKQLAGFLIETRTFVELSTEHA